jgi:polysaccharide export outer membrane protein
MRRYLLALICLAPAAAAMAQTASRDSAAMAAAGQISDQPYHVGPEDVLEISVWKEDSLSKKEVVVRPDGGISFPLVGDVQASGHSVADIQREITKRLQKYIPDPVVTVAMTKILYQRIYVIGKVNKPGEFPMTRPIDVLQALAMAGGLNPFAASNDIQIVRREKGKSTTLPFRYGQVEHGDHLEQNVLLEPGDVVVVP